MKKIYLSLFFAILIVGFTSCRKEYISNPVDTNQTIVISVPDEAWATSDGIHYSASLNVPEITPYFNETGEVLVYLSYGDGIYEQIPEITNNISYTFSHSPGNLTIYAQDLNESGIIPPYNTTVKIVLVHSSY
ncbi:MAG: hypothetical protein ACJ748_12610 [Flavisolibacter sp.]